MSKYGAGDDIYARADSDDDWETDGDYENKLSEKEQRKAGTADRLVVQTEQKAQVGIAAVRQQALQKDQRAAQEGAKLAYYGGTSTKQRDGTTGHNLDKVRDESKGPQAGQAHREFTGNVGPVKGRMLKKQPKGGFKKGPAKNQGQVPMKQPMKQAPPPQKAPPQKAPGLKKAPPPQKQPVAKQAPPAGPSPAELERKRREEQEAAERARAAEEQRKREEAERKQREEEERRKREEEEAAAAAAAAAAEEEEQYYEEEQYGEEEGAAEEEQWAEEGAEEEGGYYEEEGGAAEEEQWAEEGAEEEEGWGEEEQWAEEGAEEEEAWGEEEAGGYPQAQAIGDLAAANEGDMALTTGAVYDVWDNQSDPSGWWQVADPQTGESGYAPSTYLQLL